MPERYSHRIQVFAVGICHAVRYPIIRGTMQRSKTWLREKRLFT